MGSEPSLFSSEDSVLTELSEQSTMIYEAEYFKKNNKNSITFMISDSSMAPYYKIGDYVGGIQEKNAFYFMKFKDHTCIIHLSNGIMLVRKIILGKQERIILCSLNNEYEAEVVTISEIQSIAPVIWHRTVY